MSASVSSTSVLCSVTLLLLSLSLCCSFTNSLNVPETPHNKWFSLGKEELQRAIEQNRRKLENRAKNVILFIGDGMGIPSVTATRLVKAQEGKLNIHETKLSWENFPNIGLSKTYNTDRPIPDSAGTATAILSGEKTSYSVIGVNENVKLGDCEAVADNHIKSILNYAQDQGKVAGIVTTTRITHATPSSAYAHSAERNWEADSDMPEPDRKICWDIARQLVDVEENQKIRVLMGGGRRKFIPNDSFDQEDIEFMGSRADGRNLLDEWMEHKKDAGLSESQYKMVMNLTQFNELDTDTVDYVMGLFAADHIGYDAHRAQDKWGTPSLAEMVETSINILKRNEDGYFLLVEEGHIDWAHHANMAHMAVNDTMAMSNAVEKAVEMTSEQDTLIIVTADHSHTFAIAGYPTFSADILTYDEDEMYADDGKPYQSFSYVNGPGYLKHRTVSGDLGQEILRKDISEFTAEEMRSLEYVSDAALPVVDDTHGGEEVAIYAKGPWAHLFHATHEQSYIAHVMMYSTCVPPYDTATHCTSQGDRSNSADQTHPGTTVTLFVAFIWACWTAKYD